MILRRLFLAVLAVLLPLAAHAQSPAAQSLAPESSGAGQQLEGAWDLRLDATTVFRFEIARAADGEWQGRWLRPEAFNSDGNAFYNIRGGVKNTSSMTGIAVGDAVELGFDDPRPGAIPDIFRFRLTGPDSAEMIYVGTPLAPYAMVRVTEGERMGPWDAARIYSRVVAQARPGGQLERVTPGIDFELAGQSLGRPAAQPAPVPQPGEDAAPTEPATAAPRVEADFLDGL